MSHRLRRKPPGLVPILVWSPWSRFLEQRGSGSLVPARGGHPGGRGGVGEHEGHESYLWVVSVDAEVAGDGSRRPAAAVSGDGEVPAADSRRARAWEYQRVGANPFGGSVQLQACRRRPTARGMAQPWQPRRRCASPHARAREQGQGGRQSRRESRGGSHGCLACC